MLKQLEVDALKADLRAISMLLDDHSKVEDPIGYRQFSARKERLERQLADVVGQPQRFASVGLFFGGTPVIGSRGIVADFGARAIEHFQNVVSTRFASLEGRVGARGPTKQRGQTQMLLTDVVRGSFGFVLEQMNDRVEGQTDLTEVVSEVVDIIYRASDQSMEIFEEVADAVDDRVLGSMQSFFKVLDESGATLRLVENERDLLIGKEDIHRARERVDNISIEDTTKVIKGKLYVIPHSKKFELIMQGGTIMKGSVAPEGLASLQDEDGTFGRGALGSWCSVEIQIREVKLAGQTPRYNHRLLKVLGIKEAAPEPDEGPQTVHEAGLLP